MPERAPRRTGDRWLSERRRAAVSLVLAAGTVCLLAGIDARWDRMSAADVAAFGLLSYLVPYLVLTAFTFSTAPAERIRTWARRGARGTVLQRYVLGTAPGPGVSLFIAVGALLVAVVWFPGHISSALPTAARGVTALVLVVVAWVSVVVAFAVAFHADDLAEGGRALDFPGGREPVWGDYVYFALSVMTTFGTTDVTVRSRAMRRTVAANAVIAFAFNTVTVASVVSALNTTG
ncbi:putative membrane protein [Kitasatospora cineracea]|uniref:Membrane protein n=1 Tax=Kitasatospora cineracea TaxID=88074 RepID=A0A3N4S6H3_9ACTN|nr:putative membrane protein [Kitasatospora cineracea]